MAFPRKRFDGKLDGKNIKYFTKQLDYKLDQENRIKLSKDILYNSNGLEEYFVLFFDQKKKKGELHYNPHIKQDDFLSHEINVFQELEKIANYIIFSPDGERINKKTKYNFYTEYRFEKLLNKENNIDNMVKLDENDDSGDEYFEKYEEVIAFLLDKNQNYKKNIKQKIYEKDFYDNDFYTLINYVDNKNNINIIESNYLLNYQCFINYLRGRLQLIKIVNKKLKSNKHVSENDMREYKKWSILKKKVEVQLSQLKQDQIVLKNQIKGTIYFKQPLHDSTHADYDQFDFLDPKHVFALLKCHTKDLKSDLGCLINVLNTMLDKINLTEEEKNIICIYRIEEKSKQSEIANSFGYTKQYINQIINKICIRVSKYYYKIYENEYYLNVCKGIYKKCNVCGNIKLCTNTYFGINNRNKDGFQNICKDCELDKNK